MSATDPRLLRAIIVDDEPMSRMAIRRLVARFCRGVIVVGEAEGSNSGKELIERERPDLVFLDIEMPSGSGFELLEAFPERDFDTIIVTAHERHALRAVGYGPLGYLLKPIDINELMAAIATVTERRRRSPRTFPPTIPSSTKGSPS